jgi:predicted HTH transcriptional regulator
MPRTRDQSNTYTMSLQYEISQILKEGNNSNVQFLAMLPPSDLIAYFISAFSNTDGDYIVLGVSIHPDKLDIHGISSDFNATLITQKAVNLLSPLPIATFGYISYKRKQVFAIKVQKAPHSIRLNGKEYSERKRHHRSNACPRSCDQQE